MLASHENVSGITCIYIICIIYLESSTVKSIFISTLEHHIDLLGYH